MIINQANLGAIYKGFRTIFNQAFEGVQSDAERVAMSVPSSVREETYGWLGTFPKMREWIGDRHIKNLEAHGYTIKNKDWESSVSVDRNDIDDDNYGVYNPVVSEMGRSSAAHYEELVYGLLPLGFSTLCYDGQYFFDTDHPVGNGEVSNSGGGSGTSWYLIDATRAIKPLILQKRKPAEFVSLDKPTDENVFMRKKYIYGVDCRDNAGFGLWQLAYGSKQTLSAANYEAARAAMMSFKDDEGKPLGVKPSLLVVPPSLEGKAREILLNERNADGSTNTWRNTAELLVTPWLG
ncbi:MAG: Mu-like prophage major head subunit gpT family protein [Deltaproteobacteria bacterium]|nr:Mu-like prophage major head subunit gpT family protein [Deltaproteobacteria bacterium]MCL4873118.1 Mu-like prophage major head subunit gpT family protein [bacterium]